MRRFRPASETFPARGLVIALQRSVEDAGERDVVARVRDGDLRALDILLERHASRVYRIALGVSGSAGTAETVALAVFARLVDHGRRPDLYEGLARWLCRATIVEALRAATPRESASVAAVRTKRGPLQPLRRAVGTVSGMGTIAPGRPARTRIQETMSGLDPEDRATLVLHDGEGLSLDDVARALGEEHALVRWRLHRARLALCGSPSADVRSVSSRETPDRS